MNDIDLTSGTRYCNFKYVGPDVTVGTGSARKLPFLCTCGAISKIRVNNVTNGQKTCGKCNISALKKGDRFGQLRYDGCDIDIGISKKKMPFLCDCGKHKMISLRSVRHGASKSCGECATLILHNGEKYHEFTYIGPEISVHPNSPKKLLFQCFCGKSELRSINTVTTNKSRSCGHCDDVELISGQKYGSFIFVGSPITIASGSKQKLEFKCRCGAIKKIQLGSVTRGDSKTCGACFVSAFEWWTKNKATIKSMKCPVTRDDFPSGGPEPVETIYDVRSPFRAKCPICSAMYHPALYSIKRGVSITCGCSNNKVSGLNLGISSYIESLGFKVENEFHLENKRFDIAVPDKMLLIEVHGLRWHTGTKSHKRDLLKFKMAVDAGFHIIVIFEDEWHFKRDVMKSIIANLLGSNKAIKLRPSNCGIKLVASSVLGVLYEKHHYIGKCSAKFHYGIYYNGLLIGGMSFRKPVRQTCKGEYEVARMVMNPKFRVHGVWSKIMGMFATKISAKSIITYSDNRLFNGKTYELMGFKLDGAVRHDYYWAKNGRRFQKSSMRKPRGCAKTETELRTEQGFQKIWDYGKTRWIYIIPP